MKLGYFTGLAVTGMVFLVIQTEQGLPSRFPGEALRIANYVNDKTAPLAECQFSGLALEKRKDFCRIGASGRPPTWIVYGDSHAWAAHGVFDDWLRLNGQAGLFMFLHSCPPLVGVHVYRDRGLCFAFNDSVAEFLKQDSGIRSVILVSTWRQAIEGRLAGSPEASPSRKESVALFEKQFAATLRNLRSMGKEIYVWEPVPGASSIVPVGLARAVVTGQPADIRIRREDYLATHDYFFRALEQNGRYIAKSFSPSASLCGTGSCAVMIDGSPVYFDNNHIAKSQSAFWVEEIGKQWGRP